jgi:hypothetical protein
MGYRRLCTRGRGDLYIELLARRGAHSQQLISSSSHRRSPKAYTCVGTLYRAFGLAFGAPLSMRQAVYGSYVTVTSM